jgi:hypothetical protein
MSKLLEKIASWFKSRSYGSDLEAYIISKNPQNTADVEKYAREYDAGIWARGL